MNLREAKEIGMKERAYNHCGKVLKEITAKGKATIKINCTGLELAVNRGDSLHMKLQTLFAQLREEIMEYKITAQPKKKTAPAPYGAVDIDEEERIREEERLEKKRAYNREYQRRYYARKKQERLSAQSVKEVSES